MYSNPNNTKTQTQTQLQALTLLVHIPPPLHPPLHLSAGIRPSHTSPRVRDSASGG
ncbi:hypothetical protein HYDPIDRAFT_120195 [Hydnomerulius pinastri MD-312]|uniref:Uncharacterized protein n=1 Tax=Hydnomerulius pinastri MD-312 TaxID=994086 RepID=A0A0C9VX64_9AGAM|nr:hypothetical protein HYDPIDRAFT_120195 [Hydnomerulius pinastri MD-312]